MCLDLFLSVLIVFLLIFVFSFILFSFSRNEYMRNDGQKLTKMLLTNTNYLLSLNKLK